MSFWERYEDLRKRIKAKVDAPCDTPEEQATHDRLAACDNLHHNEGHTPPMRWPAGIQRRTLHLPQRRSNSMKKDLQQIITACAATTQAKGFDLSQHATTIGLIATEVTEALRCLDVEGKSTDLILAGPLYGYLMRLTGATDYLEQYRRQGTDHFDNSTIRDQEHLLEELGDICIRVFSYIGANGFTDQFITTMLQKIQDGATRPPLHGKQF